MADGGFQQAEAGGEQWMHKWRHDTRKEVVTYPEIIQEILEGQIDSFTEKYSFCEVKTHFVKPGDDLEHALNTYCKVALYPNSVYTITRSLHIMSACYLIGNGATIKVDAECSSALSFSNSIDGPMILGMDLPTITDVTFVGISSIGQLIFSTCKILIHGCTFLNVLGTCLRTTTACYIRGCLFVSCERAVRADGEYPINIKHCTFRNCVVCICSKCDFEVSGNTCEGSVSFLLSSGSGKLHNNFVTGADTNEHFKDLDLFTCFGGVVYPLNTIHLVASRRKTWPSMNQNSFFKCKMFFGYRKGICKPNQCAFHFSTICLDINAANKLSLHGSYDQTVTVLKIISSGEDNKVLVSCECGAGHFYSENRTSTITEDTKINHFAQSCQCLEFSSDEE